MIKNRSKFFCPTVEKSFLDSLKVFRITSPKMIKLTVLTSLNKFFYMIEDRSISISLHLCNIFDRFVLFKKFLCFQVAFCIATTSCPLTFIASSFDGAVLRFF